MKKTVTVTVDVLSHKMNPDLKVLSAAEKAKVLKKFGVDDNSVPKILPTDQLVGALKAKPGDLIRIERNDGTGKYLSYRIVVEG